MDDVTAERLREENKIRDIEENEDHCETERDPKIVGENIEESDVQTNESQGTSQSHSSNRNVLKPPENSRQIPLFVQKS